MGNSFKEDKDLITYDNINMKDINDINYDINNEFKNYNFIDNINSLKNKNNSSTNLFKRQINSCNNTINNNSCKEALILTKIM